MVISRRMASRQSTITLTSLRIMSVQRASQRSVKITTSSMPAAAWWCGTQPCGFPETIPMVSLRGIMNSRRTAPCTFPTPTVKRRLLKRTGSCTLRLMVSTRPMAWMSWMANTTMPIPTEYWQLTQLCICPISTICSNPATATLPLTQKVSWSRPDL